MSFSRGDPGLSHVASCHESIHGVTVESVQGNQVYLEWIGTLVAGVQLWWIQGIRRGVEVGILEKVI